MPAMAMVHDIDPADDLRNKLGNLDHIEIFHNQVLCAVYVRPDKTKGGIILADTTREEDKMQGKAGLIVKLGPTAFRGADGDAWAWGEGLGEGDWVYYRASDGWAITLLGPHGDKVLCRILDDTNVRGRITAPDSVW